MTKQPKTDSMEERLKKGLFKLSLPQPVVANDVGLSTYKTKELLGFIHQEIAQVRREDIKIIEARLKTWKENHQAEILQNYLVEWAVDNLFGDILFDLDKPEHKLKGVKSEETSSG